MSGEISYAKYIVLPSDIQKLKVFYGTYKLCIMPNHYNQSVASYLKMAEEARKTFPNLDLDNCQCCVVSKSHIVNRMPFLLFVTSFKDIDWKIPDGWTVISSFNQLHIEDYY